MQRILFFGDSLTAGYGLSDPGKESFHALMQEKITNAGLDYSVVNAGLSGDTSAGGLQRLSYWLNGGVDIFVLELGINDAIRRVASEKTLQNLRAIVQQVKQKYPGVKLALMGMQLPPHLAGASAAEFSSSYQQLADEFGMALVPFFLSGVAGKSNLNLRDGLHPSAEGYRIIAENVWPVLKALL